MISEILLIMVALEHLYILWIEMFAWETSGRRIFKNALPDELFHPTKKLAANQGLYNGFLAAGLLWTFFISDTVWKTNISVFFLACISLAGIYGAISSERKIFFVQALPALVTLVFVIFR